MARTDPKDSHHAPFFFRRKVTACSLTQFVIASSRDRRWENFLQQFITKKIRLSTYKTIVQNMTNVMDIEVSGKTIVLYILTARVTQRRAGQPRRPFVSRHLTRQTFPSQV